VGLAVTGPLKGSRVSKACPRMIVPHVTSILECTDDARKLWEDAPWS